jgi:hypothetical protein
MQRFEAETDEHRYGLCVGLVERLKTFFALERPGIEHWDERDIHCVCPSLLYSLRPGCAKLAHQATLPLFAQRNYEVSLGQPRRFSQAAILVVIA